LLIPCRNSLPVPNVDAVPKIISLAAVLLEYVPSKKVILTRNLNVYASRSLVAVVQRGNEAADCPELNGHATGINWPPIGIAVRAYDIGNSDVLEI
jgi:hypothetical protein